jgi:ribonuclease E
LLDEDITTEAGSSATNTAADAAPAKKAATKKAPTKKATVKAAAKAPAKKAPAKRTTAKKAAAAEPAEPAGDAVTETAATKTAAKKAPAKKAAAKAPAKKAPAKKAAAKKTPAKKVASAELPLESEDTSGAPAAAPAASALAVPLFQAPDAAKATPVRRTRKAAAKPEPVVEEPDAAAPAEEPADKPAKKQPASRTRKKAAAKPDHAAEETETSTTGEAPAAEETDAEESADDSEGGTSRRRRRRGGRRRRKGGEGGENGDDNESDEQSSSEDDADDSESTGSRRRRRRRRAGEDGGDAPDDPANTVVRVRKGRTGEDQITSLSGSTRLEAKKQRRREGREAGRRRAPIVSEAEFLARRESVERVMAIRQRDDLTQIAVLEDKVLVEHYVARESQTSLIGNVYLGRVQNVLPSMEAAFIDIGKGRNAVLYAGEVNWSSLGHKDGQPRKIESVLSSGQSVLVQVTKDPMGHKGARLTSQISLAGRFLVYVPDGTTSGISRKLPDTERTRLKTLLKEIVPDTAGVIVRTAAEGASEDELTRDVERLKARWDDIEKATKSGNAPKLLYGEPDLTLKVVRDLFTEDFTKMVIQGDDAWDTVQGYVSHVAPDLETRLERYDKNGDVFSAYRIDEQIAKGLDRKVWLPSGGSLVIDRTEAMTVVDVNTGKFTGSGGNLEETVTKNNLEAAEEIVRQLRLRDIGGIIVVDFIDMVLESNRDLVLRRLVECLGRDRTRHQVAEVTSLGLVQMTRKRIGTGLLEAFSETCEHCSGRGVLVHDMPIEQRKTEDEGRRSGRRGRGRKGDAAEATPPRPPSPKDVAAVARPENADQAAAEDEAAEVPQAPVVDVPDEVAPVEAVEPVVELEPVVEPESIVEPDRLPEPEPAPEVAAAPKVITRTRRVARRPAGSSTQAEAPVVAVPLTPATPEPAAEVVAEPTAESTDGAGTTPAVEPPKVVTRTRRRSASRPAGSSTSAEPAEPVVPVAESTDGSDGSADGSTDESGDAGTTPTVEPPKVITRTRRRSASRPAGPAAAGTAEDAGSAESGAVAVIEQDGDQESLDFGDDGPQLELHVPIKKRGSRRR